MGTCKERLHNKKSIRCYDIIYIHIMSFVCLLIRKHQRREYRKSNSYNTNNNNNNNNNIDNNNNNTDLLNNALNEIKQLKTKFYESDIEREGFIN
ncbi:hypothetical protein Glove_138g25 [Diversispora epigaea]|uniref:Uncharacterized protein n=1 Tax=Diversispora epigaea TaxID=1348612 RepID=A0A397J4S4_9GLOM|nr:hypothetical protein Glove_138g25 [Diversispora epigaea]